MNYNFKIGIGKGTHEGAPSWHSFRELRLPCPSLLLIVSEFIGIVKHGL